MGHHRNPLGNTSVTTYSRDDVFGGLNLQSMVLSQIAAGARPLSPQARGGKPPIIDLPFPAEWVQNPKLPAFLLQAAPSGSSKGSPPTEATSDGTHGWEQHLPARRREEDEHTNYNSDSDGEGSVTNDKVEPNTELALIYNEATGTLHCAELVENHTDMRHCISNGAANWATKCRCELVKTSFKTV